MGKRRKGQEERHRRQPQSPAQHHKHPAAVRSQLSSLPSPFLPRNPPNMRTERENQKQDWVKHEEHEKNIKEPALESSFSARTKVKCSQKQRKNGAYTQTVLLSERRSALTNPLRIYTVTDSPAGQSLGRHGMI